MDRTPPRKTFVLIDQSIKDLGGHHFEYAERILAQAKEAGHNTLLLSNRDLPANDETGHRTVPVFRRTFWENFSPPPRGLRSALNFQRSLKVLRARVGAWAKRRILEQSYTRHGYVMMWAWDAMRAGPDQPVLATAGLSHDSSRILAVSCRLFWKVYFWLSRNRFVKRTLQLMAAATGAILALVAALAIATVAPFVFVRQLLREGPDFMRSAADMFASDLEHAFAKIDAHDLSYIFVPTLHTTELDGIRSFLVKNPQFQTVPWGLLYRRNIFSGYPHEYRSQVEGMRSLKVTFDRCRSSLPAANLTFQTDTIELTDQYDQLGVYKFQTLPVPADFTAADKTRPPPDARKPLTFTYLGDARDEKGFHLLPDLHRDIFSDYIATGRARFLLQSNFNVPGGETGSRWAYKIFRDDQTEGVELVAGPFGREAYKEMIAKTDVMLLPYHARNYAARSSGVFAEAVAVGIPAIIPDGSWMAAVLEPHRQAFLASIFPVEGDAPRRLKIVHNISPAQHVISERLPIDAAMAGSLFELAASGRYLVVRVTMVGIEDIIADVTVTFLNGSGVPFETAHHSATYHGPTVRLAFNIPPGIRKVWVKAQPVASAMSLADVDVTVDVFDATSVLPLGVCSGTYGANINGLAQSVREVVENYDHYYESARQLASVLRPLYDARLLVDKLIAPHRDQLRADVPQRRREAAANPFLAEF